MYQTKYVALFLGLLFMGSNAQAQTLQEKILLESPRFSFNANFDYSTNLQDTDTFQNRRNSVIGLSPRYRLNDTWTLLGRAGFAQSFTQENRSDLLNTSLSITRRPYKLGRYANLRPTYTLILPTNEVQRNDDSLNGALQVSGNAFINTNTNFILAFGASGRLNTHDFSISAISGANIERVISAWNTLGWQITPKWQIIGQSVYRVATTYRGSNRNQFVLAQSITYIPSRKYSISVGHDNRGSVFQKDGSGSNVNLFESTTSVFFVSALLNF